MGVTFKVQSPVSTGLFLCLYILENAQQRTCISLFNATPGKLGAKFALLLNFHPKPPSYIITRRKQQMRTIADWIY
jgi:hypothetical protein